MIMKRKTNQIRKILYLAYVLFTPNHFFFHLYNGNSTRRTAYGEATVSCFCVFSVLPGSWIRIVLNRIYRVCVYHSRFTIEKYWAKRICFNFSKRFVSVWFSCSLGFCYEYFQFKWLKSHWKWFEIGIKSTHQNTFSMQEARQVTGSHLFNTYTHFIVEKLFTFIRTAFVSIQTKR